MHACVRVRSIPDQQAQSQARRRPLAHAGRAELVSAAVRIVPTSFVSV